ncbi:hypothetical protein ACFW04_002586 [Cataglyphis niger]
MALLDFCKINQNLFFIYNNFYFFVLQIYCLKVDLLKMADTQSVTENTDESEKQDDPMKNYKFDGQTYIYTDKATNITYRFDQENNKWVVKEDDKVNSDNKESSDRKEKEENSGPEVSATGAFGFENDTHTYTDPNDGSVYFWDKEKNAWFPKVDQDFMARYQMSYGFADTSAPQSNPPEPKELTSPQKAKEEKEQRKLEAKRKAQEPPTWFEVDEAHNTAIYVSGLPLDITMDELTELFSKCGLIARDERGKDKIKLYKDGNGEPKGDALCTYIKVLCHYLFTYRLFDWRPERMRGEPLKCERVVIIKNLFTPEDFDREVQLLLEYQQDIRSECLKCGDVKKVVIYDRHPEGVAQVTFREPAEAQACVQLLNGRWFSQRKISAEIWDGKTKYKITETDAEIEARLQNWDTYLEQEDERKEKKEQETKSSNIDQKTSQ